MQLILLSEILNQLQNWIMREVVLLCDGNLILLCSLPLDLVRCMQLSLMLSRSNTMKTNGHKNHIRIEI